MAMNNKNAKIWWLLCSITYHASERPPLCGLPRRVIGRPSPAIGCQRAFKVIYRHDWLVAEFREIIWLVALSANLWSQQVAL